MSLIEAFKVSLLFNVPITIGAYLIHVVRYERTEVSSKLG